MNAKHTATRKKLGFKPINEKFDQSEAHHFTNHHVVFVPKPLHKSVPHSISNLKSMGMINQKVREWLVVEEDFGTLEKFDEMVSLTSQIKISYFLPI